MRIPYVSAHAVGDGFEASAGFRLRTILSERLLEDPHRPPDRNERLRQAHQDGVRLLQLLAGWSWPVQLELHVVSCPSLDARQPGGVRISVRLDVAAPDRESALERCLSTSVTLESLLEVCWWHGEFEPVADAAAFEGCFRPFEAESAVVVERRAESISLAQPFRPGKKSIGFHRPSPQPVPAQATEGVVEHLFAWTPPLDDWSALLGALLLQPAPMWMVVRMANGADATAALCRLDATIAACERFLACAPPDQTTLAGQAIALRDASLYRALQLRTAALRAGAGETGPPDK
jgi:hypothetical protein